MLKTAEGYQSFEEILEQKVEKMLKADGVVLFAGYLTASKEEGQPATIEWDFIRHKFPNTDLPAAVKKFREHAYGDMEGGG